MSCYAYCDTCDKEMGAPTKDEILLPYENYSCLHCGAIQDHSETIGEIVHGLIERIEILEKANDK